MSIWGMLESVASAYRATVGKDAVEGTTQNFDQTLFSGVACSYQESGASVVDVYGQRQTQVSPSVYFAQYPDVEANDKVVVTTKNQDGTTTDTPLIVQGRAEPVARARLWQVSVQRLNQP
jgi:K+/H+ antiporter YhaU regulatory subunit KhtT